MMTTTWKVALVAVMLATGVVVAGAQALEPAASAPDVPVVSETDRLRLLVAARDLELAELRRQVAAQTLQQMIAALQRPGYTLDLETMRYTPKPQEATTTE